MTVADNYDPVIYVGNGATTSFPFNFPIATEDDLQVYLRTISSGAMTKLILGDYTLVGTFPGTGSVTYNPAGVPIPATQALVLYRITVPTQAMDITTQGGFYPTVLEDQLDRMEMQIQELLERDSRTPKFKLGTVAAADLVFPEPSANKLIGWDGAGVALENKTSVALGTEVLPAVASRFIRRNAANTAYEALAGDESSNLMSLAGTTTAARIYLGVAHVVNPKWYAVVGDGVADDAAAFQACVTAAAGRAIWIDGLTIRIPTGNEITVPATGLCLRGKGKIVYEGTGNLFKAATLTTTNLDFVATAAQTVFSAAYAYSDPDVEVTVNGTRKDHNTYTQTHDGTNLIITFTSGATLNDAVQVQATQITAGGLNGTAQVIIGSGVKIHTTQVAEGRIAALGWNDGDFADRQHCRFLVEGGAEFQGEDGTKGFRGFFWLHACIDGRFHGTIAGVGANDLSPTQVKCTTCKYGIKHTGSKTPSPFVVSDAHIGFVDKALVPGQTTEGLHVANSNFLNVGYAAYWVTGWNSGPVRSFDFLNNWVNNHVNAMKGVIYSDSVSEMCVIGNDFYQSPLSTATQFQFISHNGRSGKVIGNVMKSFVAGATVHGVVNRSGAKHCFVAYNTFEALDATGSYYGVICQSGSDRNVTGPNTYDDIDVGVDIQSGSTKCAIITDGDMFETAPETARYLLNGTDYWRDKPWYYGIRSTTLAVSNVTWTAVGMTETLDPLGVAAGGNPTVPAWAKTMYVKAFIPWPANSTGQRMAKVLLDGVDTELKVIAPAPADGVGANWIVGEVDVSSLTGDVLTVQVYQNAGGGLTMPAGFKIWVLFE